MNAPQSSRIAKSQTSKAINVSSGVLAGNANIRVYTPIMGKTRDGSSNPQLKETVTAKPQHYLLIAAIVIGVVIYASKKLDG